MKLGKRVLVVTSDFPFPPNSGGRLDSWSNFLRLKSLGAEIDLLTSVKSQPDAQSIETVKGFVNRLTIVPRTHSLTAALRINPFQIESRNALQSLPLDVDYDLLFMDSDYATAIYGNPTLRTRKTVQRVQNDESKFQLDMARATSSPFKKAFHSLESFRFSRYQRRVRPLADWLFFISDHERAEYLKEYPGREARSLFVPPSVDVSAAKQRTLAGRRVVFIATLALPSNQAGIRWYLKNVHPKLLSIEGYELLVAGNTLGQDLEVCEEAARAIRVVLIKDPADLEKLYDSGAVFINPVLHGAGLKLKTVNAILAGLPVVTTAVGAEGTGLVDGEHVEITDEPENFAKRVGDLLIDKACGQRLVTNSQAFVRERYDTERVFRRILNEES